MTGPTLVIDPGHGGTAPAGASSPNRGISSSGLLEKDVALDLARRIRDFLIGEHVVILTRDSDTNLALADRAGTAKALGAAAFVSLHFSGDNPALDRTDVIVAKGASRASRALADRLLAAAKEMTGAPGTVHSADLGQLAADRHDPATAAALVEIASLAVPERAAAFADSAYLGRLAQSLASAIRESLPVPVGSELGWGKGSLARGATIYPPDADPGYAPDGLGAAVSIWADWLARRAAWEIGVPDTAITQFPHAGICEFRRWNAANEMRYGGTGFYIADEVILTAGHVIKETDGFETSRIEVMPGRSPRMSTFPSKTFDIDWQAVVHPKWAASQDTGFDLAVLRVPGLPAPKGSFRLANVSLSPSAGIVICGYGKVADVPYEDQGQRMDGAHVASTDFERLHYPIMTMGGHSGSPVFHGSMVIGVHRAARDDLSLNEAVLLTPDKTDWIASKAGVPLSFGQSAGAVRRAGGVRASALGANPAPPPPALDAWVPLIRLKPAASVQARFVKFTPDAELHKIEDAYGPVNLDWYPVRATLPDSVTPEAVLDAWRRDVNAVIDTRMAYFEPYDPEEGALWAAADPSGAVIHIDMRSGAEWANPDDGSVVVAEAAPDHWIFSTVWTPADFAHPVSGNRWFGFIRNDDGTVTFGTRGADRTTGFADDVLSGIVFTSAHALWMSLQQGLARLVTSFGGTATIGPAISERYDWPSVQSTYSVP